MNNMEYIIRSNRIVGMRAPDAPVLPESVWRLPLVPDLEPVAVSLKAKRAPRKARAKA